MATLTLCELLSYKEAGKPIDYSTVPENLQSYLLENIVAWEILKPSGFKDDVLSALGPIPSHLVALHHLVAALQHSKPKTKS
jgi:hypothetical protein